MVTLHLFGREVISLGIHQDSGESPAAAAGLPFGFSGGSFVQAERTFD